MEHILFAGHHSKLFTNINTLSPRNHSVGPVPLLTPSYDEKTEAQIGEAPGLRSHSWWGVEPGYKLRFQNLYNKLFKPKQSVILKHQMTTVMALPLGVLSTLERLAPVTGGCVLWPGLILFSEKPQTQNKEMNLLCLTSELLFGYIQSRYFVA